MRSIGQTLSSLAPAINSQELPEEVTAEMLVQGRVDVSSRYHNGKLYFFTVNINRRATTAKFQLPNSRADASFSVINEDRTVQAVSGEFTEEFEPYEFEVTQDDLIVEGSTRVLLDSLRELATEEAVVGETISTGEMPFLKVEGGLELSLTAACFN